MRLIVGFGSCGMAAGAGKVYVEIENEIKKRKLNIDLQITGCIGMCYLEPIVDMINDQGIKSTYVKVTPEKVSEIISKAIIEKDGANQYRMDHEDKYILEKQKRIAIRNCGIINPEEIHQYINRGGYAAIENCIRHKTPEEVIEQIKISGLRGRGGAGFPTWFKWNAARQSIGSPKYIVCNADEGDPGAFMDRSILEGDPHGLIEGMLIGGYAIGAEIGIIYVRAEYPLAIVRLEKAIQQAKEKGLLGNNLFGENRFNFELRIKAGAGAFVCGEETALIASLEGERGMPRLKPPFPAQKGYWQNPTNINNVETFANVPWILTHGGEAYAALGTEKSKGTKVFALTGKIKKGGLVEVPMGMPLREIIFDIGGGILNDTQFKAIQMGGPSGGCIPANLLDTPVEYESIMKTGAIMGSGGMVVMDETTCMVDMARFFLDFTRKESCGKCIHCRLGTKRMLEILNRICDGQGKHGDIELLEELSIQIKEGSLCGLGQTAPNPVLSTIRYFREEYERHIYDKRCPAKQCSSLIYYKIIGANCVGCGVCKKHCPTDAISGERKQIHQIEKEKCVKCGKCNEVCRFHAIEIE
ncbi:NADH-quinone oxidoreductase subunit NuoF [Geosporobacter ferrireducens]|uniref:NADH-quinone oxidoreductase subunit NuoF n=1 Tax=Geosporobacter ferrireducens TaxID=1424294 RepID=UPI00139CBF8A|nr:NADH-quinone oxidoreductase subunit NuoF [Geosporobacter ferrireducens]MTI55362.1 NADH-quinone oxidoreductase subunit NuoF [Geosporobacter ferrireducens]